MLPTRSPAASAARAKPSPKLDIKAPPLRGTLTLARKAFRDGEFGVARRSRAFDFSFDTAQCLGRVDIDQRRIAADGHLGDCLAITADKIARPDIPLDRHQFRKEAP